MSTEKTPGQVSWTARNMALAGPGENPADVLAGLDGAWDYLTPGQQGAEEEGARAAIAAAPAGPRACGHEFELGDSIYTCERSPHPVDGYLPIYRHAADIDAELAAGTDEGDGNGTADLVTWGEDGNGDGQDWEVAWGSVAEWEAGLTPGAMSPPARAARAAFLSHPGGNRLGNDEGWEAAAQAVLDSRTPWGDANAVSIETYPWHAVVRSGGPDGEVVKVIAWDTGTGEGLTYYDSLAEWEAADT